MKGVILAGGRGTRLGPVTKIVSKHCLPVYDKPMISYPITNLLLAGLRHILIVVDGEDVDDYECLLREIVPESITVELVIQDSPMGIVHAMLCVEEALSGDDFVLCLGDNLVYGAGLTQFLRSAVASLPTTSTIFTVWNQSPSDYGVIETDKSGKLLHIVEKPKSFVSHDVVIGLYVFQGTIFEKCRKIEKSSRGEFEISDLLSLLVESKQLERVDLGRAFAWFDLGDYSRLHEAAMFIKNMQEMHGVSIGNAKTACEWLNSV